MLDKENLPKHIAMIMDGNRTWARNKGLDPMQGHLELVVALDKVIKYSKEIGIKEITFYAFSTENWKRSKEEVDWLMDIYNKFISTFYEKYPGIKFRQLGEKERLPNFIQKSIYEMENKTNESNDMTFNMALNYGGRQELINATKQILNEVKDNKLKINEIDSQTVSNYLYTEGDSDPDLIIRTSGQIRLSNFLLWQSSYSELYFTNVYWPDFDENELEKAIIEYQKRNRKFGGK